MCNLKKWHKWTYLKVRSRPGGRESNLMVTKGDSRGRDKLGVWDKHIHTAIYRIGIRQGLTI